MKKSLFKTALAALALAFLFAACKNPSTPESKPSKPDQTPAQSNEIPLTLEALDDNTTITLFNADLVENLKYSIDGGELEDVSSSTISLSKNSCISFYGEGTSNSPSKYFNINCSADCYIYGNVMSLLYSDFKDKTEITQNYAFYELFYYNTHIKKSPQKELLLPATSLADYCYSYMFYGCSSLTKAPALPATSLADKCYVSMFHGCTSLTAAPVLPATSLADSCYAGMFYSCSSLTAVPALPATSLKDYCYADMFHGCTSLTKVPALPATSLAIGCYDNMFIGCKSLETAPGLPATSLADYCYCNMFSGCTSLTKAPDLPAISLEDYCYYGMFSGCNKLNYVKCLATDISATDCLTDWLSGVAATGTFVKAASMTTWPEGNSGIPTGWTVKNDTEPAPVPANEIPLTLEALGDNTTIILSRTDLVTNLKYSIDGAEPVAVSSSEPKEITLSKDSCISLFAEGTNNSNSENFNINCSADCYVYGNVMSLLYKDFKDKTEITQYYAFCKLFLKNSHIKNSTQKELLLPATNLAADCYSYMFGNCTSLETAPALPATSLASYCYGNMFSGCTSLTTAPALPAEDLAERCYSSMFNGCTSLKTAPALPATSLADYCYSYMFTLCTSLITAPALPAETLAESCYEYMFYSCTSLTAAPALSATSLAKGCYYEMFNGCTSLKTAPELPATSLADNCYQGMFGNCTSLIAAPALPATSLADYCYYYMFNGCTSLNSVKCLATDISAKNCLKDWLSGVASTGTFVKAASMNDWPSGRSGIPFGWKVKANVNEIPLTLEALEDTTITLLRAYRVKGLKYSIDGKDPVEVSSSPAYNSGDVEIPLSTGSCISFYGEGTDNDKYNNFCIICSADCYVYGNVMSLLFSDFKDKTVITQEYAFIRLFGGGIKNSLQKELLLPATSLAEGCYYMMFSYCTSLTTAPVLPATSLARECYESMFYNCTSLETPPVLPATSLEVNCYRNMFFGCTSLIKAPDLPATSLASYCYGNMFSGCESLTKAPDLPAISLEDGSYYWMFRDCKALETAPVLPATSLSDWCYYGMFSGCCKLNYVKCLAKDISAKKCLDDWLSGVADTGTFVKSSSASWAVAGQNGIPADWEVKDAADN